MTARPKSPAYAKSLLEARRGGRHPEFVLVIYGNDWSLPDGYSRLAVKPDEALGLDWSSVAGLPVSVLDRAVADDVNGDRELYFLLGEIARDAATVKIYTPLPLTKALLPENDSCIELAHLFAFLCRRWDQAAHRMDWPAWWSDEIDKANGDNRRRWLEETEARLARFAA